MQFCRCLCKICASVNLFSTCLLIFPCGLIYLPLKKTKMKFNSILCFTEGYDGTPALKLLRRHLPVLWVTGQRDTSTASALASFIAAASSPVYLFFLFWLLPLSFGNCLRCIHRIFKCRSGHCTCCLTLRMVIL